MILDLHITLGDTGKMNIHGIPKDEIARKITLQILGQAITTIAGMKPFDPHALIVPAHLQGQTEKPANEVLPG